MQWTLSISSCIFIDKQSFSLIKRDEQPPWISVRVIIVELQFGRHVEQRVAEQACRWMLWWFVRTARTNQYGGERVRSTGRGCFHPSTRAVSRCYCYSCSYINPVPFAKFQTNTGIIETNSKEILFPFIPLDGKHFLAVIGKVKILLRRAPLKRELKLRHAWN